MCMCVCVCIFFVVAVVGLGFSLSFKKRVKSNIPYWFCFVTLHNSVVQSVVSSGAGLISFNQKKSTN